MSKKSFKISPRTLPPSQPLSPLAETEEKGKPAAKAKIVAPRPPAKKVKASPSPYQHPSSSQKEKVEKEKRKRKEGKGKDEEEEEKKKEEEENKDKTEERVNYPYSRSFAELFRSVRPALAEKEGSIDRVLLCTIFEYIGIVEYRALRRLVRYLPQFKTEIYACVRKLRMGDNDTSLLRKDFPMFMKEGALNTMVSHLIRQLPHLRELTLPFYEDIGRDLTEPTRKKNVKIEVKDPFSRPELVVGLIFGAIRFHPAQLAALQKTYPNLRSLEGVVHMSDSRVQDYPALKPFFNSKTELNFEPNPNRADVLAVIQNYITDFPGNNFKIFGEESDFFVEDGFISFNDYSENISLPHILLQLHNIQAVEIATENFPDLVVSRFAKKKTMKQRREDEEREEKEKKERKEKRGEEEKEEKKEKKEKERKEKQGDDDEDDDKVTMIIGIRDKDLAAKDGQHFLTAFLAWNPAIQALTLTLDEEEGGEREKVGRDVLQGIIPLPPVRVLQVTNLGNSDDLQFKGQGLKTVKVLIIPIENEKQLYTALNLFPNLEKTAFSHAISKVMKHKLHKILAEWNHKHEKRVIAEEGVSSLLHEYLFRKWMGEDNRKDEKEMIEVETERIKKDTMHGIGPKGIIKK